MIHPLVFWIIKPAFRFAGHLMRESYVEWFCSRSKNSFNYAVFCYPRHYSAVFRTLKVANLQYPWIRLWMDPRSTGRFAGEIRILSLTRDSNESLEFRAHSVIIVPTELLRPVYNFLIHLRNVSCFVNVTSLSLFGLIQIVIGEV